MRSTDPQSFLPLTPVAFHILLELTAGPRHGYGIKGAVESRTEGVVRLGAGTLYHAIGSLRKRGLIAETDPPDSDSEARGTSRWRFYRITPAGSRVLQAELARLETDVKWARARLAAAGLGS